MMLFEDEAHRWAANRVGKLHISLRIEDIQSLCPGITQVKLFRVRIDFDQGGEWNLEAIIRADDFESLQAHPNLRMRRLRQRFFRGRLNVVFANGLPIRHRQNRRRRKQSGSFDEFSSRAKIQIHFRNADPLAHKWQRPFFPGRFIQQIRLWKEMAALAVLSGQLLAATQF